MFNGRKGESLYLPDVEANHQPGPYATLVADARQRAAEYGRIWDLFASRSCARE